MTMNLLQFREFFANRSGRLDLVSEDYSDEGIDTFIYEAQKFLDRLDETQKSWAVRFCDLAIGDIATTIPYCRAIKEVWVAHPTEGRYQLEKKNLLLKMEVQMKMGKMINLI